MKTVTTTIIQVVPDETFNSEEYQDFIKSIQSGELNKDMSDGRLKFKSVRSAIEITDTP